MNQGAEQRPQIVRGTKNVLAEHGFPDAAERPVTLGLRHLTYRSARFITASRTPAYRVMEIRDVDDRQAFAAPPVASGDLRMWKADVDTVLEKSAFARSQPLVGIDREFRLVGDGRHTLGVPTAVLVPTAGVIASLGIHPGELCTYHDREGTGLALVTWRAEYETSEYELARPQLRGSGILIRSDLLNRLADCAGKQRLVLRGFVVGVPELAGKASDDAARAMQ